MLRYALLAILFFWTLFSASALEWNKPLYDKLLDAKEINFTVDFRHGIYNGADSASLAQALGKDAGWEVAFFNRLRGSMVNTIGSRMKSPQGRRKFNVHLDVQTIFDNAAMQGIVKIWTDDPNDYSIYRAVSAPGRWNDWDILVAEQAANEIYTGPVFGRATVYAACFIGAAKTYGKQAEKLAKEEQKYIKDYAKAAAKSKGKTFGHGKAYNKYLELKSGSEDALGLPGLAAVEVNFDGMTYEGLPYTERLSDIELLGKQMAMNFTTGYNDKSEAWKAISAPESAQYTIVLSPEYVSYNVEDITMGGKVEIYSKDKKDTPLAVYNFDNLRGTIFNIWSGKVRSERQIIIDMMSDLAEAMAGK